jgi:hypothetical protein
VLHSEILPEHDCGGEFIELPLNSTLRTTLARPHVSDTNIAVATIHEAFGKSKGA